MIGAACSSNNVGISFMLYNSRSVVNKVENIMMTLEDRDVDIAAICETWLVSKSNPTTAKIKQHGYSILHDYRSDQRGGGTALIFKSSMKLSPICLQNFSTFECTAATLKSTCGTKIVFLVVYRTGNMCVLFNQEIDRLISDLLMKCDCLVLAGDLNIHFDQAGNRLYQQAFQMLESCGMKRHVFDPTHISGSCLDHIFTFSLHGQLDCKVTVDNKNTLLSDHFPVYCMFTLSYEKKYVKEINYRKLKDINQSDFSIHLRETFKQSVSDQLCFKESVLKLSIGTQRLLDQYAPLTKKVISVVDKAPWFDADYRQLRKQRRKAERIRNRSIENQIEYKDLCKKCSDLANVKKKEYFSNLICKAQGNLKTLYQLVNKELDRGQKNALPDNYDSISQLADDFNHFFEEKVKKIRSELPDKHFDNTFDDFPQMKLMHEFQPTSIDEIKEIIAESGIKCSPADLLPFKLFKDNLDIVLPTIVYLVNLSLSTGNMEGVKLADIIPLLKNDHLDPNVLKHFRPVSNLTFLGKLIERVVLRRLNEHLSRNNLNCCDQSAYKKDHSTETLLIRIWNDLLVATDQKTCTVMLMLDLSAAFDTVDHQLLIQILRNEIGLRGNVLSWFKSFLTGRSQRVRIDDTVSDEIIIKFGVPQGSVLGPVLFNIYIRSIYLYVKKLGFSIHGYADDHQILMTFKPINQSHVLVYDIQMCFEKVKLWMDDYYLQLNDSKSEIIVFGSNKLLNLIQIGGINFPSGITIRFASNVKNLGVFMDSTLTLNKQVVELKKKSFRVIRNINKIRFLLSKEQLKIVVNSLVVSCLDYCNGLYIGMSEKLLYQLQLIQNACAKTVTRKYKHDHLENDLIELHWLNIRKRVIFKIALLSYKSVIGKAPQYLQELFSYAHYGYSLKIIVPMFQSSYGNRSFSVMGPRILNKLPKSITSANNIASFKKLLKTYLFNLTNSEVKLLIT